MKDLRKIWNVVLLASVSAAMMVNTSCNKNEDEVTPTAAGSSDDVLAWYTKMTTVQEPTEALKTTPIAAEDGTLLYQPQVAVPNMDATAKQKFDELNGGNTTLTSTKGLGFTGWNLVKCSITEDGVTTEENNPEKGVYFFQNDGILRIYRESAGWNWAYYYVDYKVNKIYYKGEDDKEFSSVDISYLKDGKLIIKEKYTYRWNKRRC